MIAPRKPKAATTARTSSFSVRPIGETSELFTTWLPYPIPPSSQNENVIALQNGVNALEMNRILVSRLWFPIERADDRGGDAAGQRHRKEGDERGQRQAKRNACPQRSRKSRGRPRLMKVITPVISSAMKNAMTTGKM